MRKRTAQMVANEARRLGWEPTLAWQRVFLFFRIYSLALRHPTGVLAFIQRAGDPLDVSYWAARNHPSSAVDAAASLRAAFTAGAEWGLAQDESVWRVDVAAEALRRYPTNGEGADV